jgi:hypothetical protein
MLNVKSDLTKWSTATTFPSLAVEAGGEWKDCVQSLFTGAYTPGAATTAWMLGKDKATTSTGDDQKLLYAFLRIVWKKATKVGFG